jgi:hypothetical protein
VIEFLSKADLKKLPWALMVIGLIRFCVEISRLSKGVPKKLAKPYAV